MGLRFTGGAYLKAIGSVLFDQGGANPFLPFSMSCWIKPDDNTSTHTIASISRDAAGAGLPYMELDYRGDVIGTPVRAVYRGDSGGQRTASYNTNSTWTGDWRWVAGTWTNTNVRDVYWETPDQTQTSGATAPALSALDNMTFAALHAEGSEFNNFTGAIGIFGLWDIILDVNDLRQLSLGKRPEDVRRDHLLLSMPMEDLSFVPTVKPPNLGPFVATRGSGQVSLVPGPERVRAVRPHIIDPRVPVAVTVGEIMAATSAGLRRDPVVQPVEVVAY